MRRLILCHLFIFLTAITLRNVAGQNSFDSTKSSGQNLTPVEHAKYMELFTAQKLKSGGSLNDFVSVGGSQYAPIYPFMVAIVKIKDGEQPQAFCGGSLIDTKSVLTAGHCELEQEFKKGYRIEAWVGGNDLDDFQGQKIQIVAVTKHPKYVSKPGILKNDLAICELSEKVKLNENVKPICLARGDYDRRQVIQTGYGLRNCVHKSRRLQHSEARLIGAERCARIQNGSNVDRNQICAKFDDGNSDECGDSGTPIFAVNLNGQRYGQVGIMSYSYKTEVTEGSKLLCTDSKIPSTYTRVGAYLSFIYTHSKAARIC